MTSAVATQFLPVVAAASATKDYLVVSLHDVAPSTQPIVDKIISELSAKGIRHCSLLVVPDYHHQGASMKDRQFVSWLRSLEAAGNEIVIHGYFHERPRRAREGFLEKFVTQFYTQGEGEFYDLGYDEAFRRIKTARDEFLANGLKPRGFVAPAWLLNDASKAEVAAAGFRYTSDPAGLIVLPQWRHLPAPSLVWSARSGWRRMLSRAWNERLRRVHAQADLLRLGLHPVDMAHASAVRWWLDTTIALINAK